MEVNNKPLFGQRKTIEEQGSCGIRQKILKGGLERQFAVSLVAISDARPHFHRKTWELYIVQEGSGTLMLDGTMYPIKKNDVIEIPPHVIHQAIPDETLMVWVIMSPHNAEEDDIEYI